MADTAFGSGFTSDCALEAVARRKNNATLGSAVEDDGLPASEVARAYAKAELGTIGAPAAIMNAVVNALAPLGVTDLAMPVMPGRVWHAIAEHAQA